MKLTPATFDEIRQVVRDLCGIVLSADKHYLVVSRLGPLLAPNGLSSFEALLAHLKRGDSQALREQIIEAITTKETSFNRDRHPFEELRARILPALADRLLERRAAGLAPPGGRIRIWCAAAATGQEVYSVAMAVLDFLAGRPGIALGPNDFAILATDISRTALEVARRGWYSTAEVARGLAPEQRARHFRADRGGWLAAEPLRRMIDFQRLNLMDPLPNLGTFDLILCRNVLIYLDEPSRRRIGHGLYQALNPGGFLILGAAESLYGVTDTFTIERIGGTFAYRRA